MRTYLLFGERIITRKAVARKTAGNCARKGSPIFEPRRCDRHEAEKKVKATNTLALTQCANFFSPFFAESQRCN